MKLTPESRLLLRIAARIVPPDRRDEWGREWEGELWYWLTSTPEATLAARLELARHCTGAILDALWLRVDREELDRSAARVLGHPALPIVAAFVLLLSFAVNSGWFLRTRRALEGPRYPAADRVALLYQAGPLIGERHGIAASKIDAWDREAPSLEGAAAYFWYRTVFGSPARELPAVKVGPSFFQVLEVAPALGRLFRRSDAAGCEGCTVLSYEIWSRWFDRNPAIVGRRILVDGRPARVIGVLPRDFWFLDSQPAVWTLYRTGETWRVWDVPPSGAVCRLRPGVSAARAQEQLRATASILMPLSTGRQATLDPIVNSMLRSLPFYFPLFLCFLAVAAVLALIRAPARAAAFGWLNAALALGLVLLGVQEFTETGQPFAIWWFFALSIAAVYYSWRDLRVRCPICLHRLTMPVRIGHAGQVMLDHAGTELVCPNGHGMLYRPEEVSTDSESWVRV